MLVFFYLQHRRIYLFLSESEVDLLDRMVSQNDQFSQICKTTYNHVKQGYMDKFRIVKQIKFNFQI
jgi:hypothetical protein